MPLGHIIVGRVMQMALQNAPLVLRGISSSLQATVKRDDEAGLQSSHIRETKPSLIEY